MKVTREKAFETNSSSTHSITLGFGNHLVDPKSLVDDSNVITIFPGEFGWGPESFTDFSTKASYVLTDNVPYDHKDNNPSNPMLDMLKEVISEYTGAEVVFQRGSGDFYPWGYVDHQSSGTSSDSIVTKEDMRRFLFDRGSELVIDNDNG